ncbi:hypothetical protein CEXT_457751 [Caerostris extrusa]|uniref:Ycf15 n=1 Tax=Caerostris extrusa TaxID=172846 RepID=A0AAV4P2S6_CAEEX|nr:hypothetical protein CEXT_457751 [Caerostris extrusa]
MSPQNYEDGLFFMESYKRNGSDGRGILAPFQTRCKQRRPTSSLFVSFMPRLYTERVISLFFCKKEGMPFPIVLFAKVEFLVWQDITRS